MFTYLSLISVICSCSQLELEASTTWFIALLLILYVSVKCTIKANIVAIISRPLKSQTEFCSVTPRYSWNTAKICCNHTIKPIQTLCNLNIKFSPNVGNTCKVNLSKPNTCQFQTIMVTQMMIDLDRCHCIIYGIFCKIKNQNLYYCFHISNCEMYNSNQSNVPLLLYQM